MAVSRKRRRLRPVSIGFGALFFSLLPTTVAYQDLGALLVHQPGISARARAHLIASPFGTIHAAMFSLPRPIGTAIPHPPVYALANFDPNDVSGSLASQYLGDANAPLQFPAVNRRGKRDSLLSRPRQPLPPLPPVPQAQADAPLKNEEARGRFDPYSDYEFASIPDEQVAPLDKEQLSSPNEDGARVYFGADPMAAGEQPITPWAIGEAPIVMASRISGDPDIKQSALGPPGESGEGAAGESIASKGELPAPTNGRNRQRNGWGSRALHTANRRSAWPMRFISKHAARRCAGKSPWPRWC